MRDTQARHDAFGAELGVDRAFRLMRIAMMATTTRGVPASLKAIPADHTWAVLTVYPAKRGRFYGLEAQVYFDVTTHPDVAQARVRASYAAFRERSFGGGGRPRVTEPSLTMRLLLRLRIASLAAFS
jgi:hypothetical protein